MSDGVGGPRRIEGVRTVLFDAGFTLVQVDLGLVGEALAAEGHARARGELRAAEESARAALYRRLEADPGRDDRGRWDLYAATFLEELGLDDGAARAVRRRLDDIHRDRHLWRSPAPGARAALEELAGRGFRLGVVSNSDGRLRELLEQISLAAALEVIVDSQRVGVEKPDPRIFRIALEQLGERACAAVYVGDAPPIDVAGARHAGLRPVLLDPLGLWPRAAEPRLRRLGELGALLPPRAASRAGGGNPPARRGLSGTSP